MARLFDVVEYPDEMRNELVHKFPETGSGDFHIGTQLIVRETQAVVFFRDGQALDTFSVGRHTRGFGIFRCGSRTGGRAWCGGGQARPSGRRSEPIVWTRAWLSASSRTPIGSPSWNRAASMGGW